MNPIVTKRLFPVLFTALLLAGCAVFGDAPAKIPASPAPSRSSPATTHPSPPFAQPAETQAPSAVPTPTATLSAPPTETPFPTPAPLTREAVLSCPVSLPNLAESPDEYFLPAESGYGNPERTIFIGLWPGGKVYFYPGGPGRIAPDGSLGMKFWFYRTVPGEAVFSGRRLDAPAPPMPELVLRGEEDGYGERGFQPAGLIFSSEGCWEVTARIGAEQMTFVTLAARAPFAPFWPAWLPEGLSLVDSDLTGLPDSFRQVYGFPGQSQSALVIETAQDESASSGETPQAPLFASGLRGGCAQGEGEKKAQASREEAVLEWSAEGLRYRIYQAGLGLSCEELRRVAGLDQRKQ